jgi:toxin ParE1/3/4
VNPPLVRVSPAADQDLTNCFHYIASDNFDAAMRFVAAVEADYRRLAEMPGMGAKRHEFVRFPNLRSWPVHGFRNYLVFYRPLDKGKGIEILRLLHGAQNLEQFFD